MDLLVEIKLVEKKDMCCAIKSAIEHIEMLFFSKWSMLKI